MALGRPQVCPRHKPSCPKDKPRVSPFIVHSLEVCPRNKRQFGCGTNQSQRAAGKVYVLNVYVPFSLTSAMNEFI